MWKYCTLFDDTSEIKGLADAGKELALVSLREQFELSNFAMDRKEHVAGVT